MDFIDRFRHWLIRKIACGDSIIMNVDYRANGTIVTQNLGPALMYNINVENYDNNKPYGFYFGHEGRGVISIRPLNTQPWFIKDVFIRFF